jgi:hypothetical protein
MQPNRTASSRAVLNLFDRYILEKDAPAFCDGRLDSGLETAGMTPEAATTFVMPAKLVPACFKPGAGIQGIWKNATFQPQRT